MGFLNNALSTRRAMQELPPMKEIHYISDEELRQLQDCFLEIIKDIDRVCRENGICYMAAGGTALGSVRHRGFIPWDDDVDLLMPRPDLKRFLEIFDRTLGDKYEITSPASKYPLESMITAVYKKNTVKASLQTMDTDLPQGVHIDIFCIESVPTNAAARRINELAPKLKNVEGFAREYAYDADRALPEAGALESAKSYREKKAKPFFDKVVKVLRSLYNKYLELKHSFERLTGDYTLLQQRYASLNQSFDRVQEENRELKAAVKDYDTLCRGCGREKIAARVQAIRDQETAERQQRRTRHRHEVEAR